MADAEKQARPKQFRLKGTTDKAGYFDTMQMHVIINIEDLQAAENVEKFIVQRMVSAAAELAGQWAESKDNIEAVPEEGR